MLVGIPIGSWGFPSEILKSGKFSQPTCPFESKGRQPQVILCPGALVMMFLCFEVLLAAMAAMKQKVQTSQVILKPYLVSWNIPHSHPVAKHN